MPLVANPHLVHVLSELGVILLMFSVGLELRISTLARQTDIAVPMLLLQHDAAVNPGSSGGPLVDAEGRLLGMNSQIADGSRMFVGIAYAIPTAELDRIVTGLVEETLPPFPTLGLTARPVDRQVAEALGTDAQGLLIDAVAPGSLAEISGLQPGDTIIQASGTTFIAPGDFAFAIESATADGSATLDIEGRQIKAGVNPELLKQMEALVPLGRGGTPEEAAGAIALLCYPESNYISGELLVCGGGFRI